MNLTTFSADLVPGSTTLYLFFGGVAGAIAMPPFEFYRAAQIIGDSKIFIRDLDQCWYHAGLRGCSHDIDSTVRFLRREIDRIEAQRVVLVGNSMGGYAAMLFAALLGTGEVIAFAPQTFISPSLRLRHHDGRWPRQIAKAWWRGLLGQRRWDLRPILALNGAGLKVSVFVSPGDPLDAIHARHIEGLPGVVVHWIDGGGHDLVRVLRDTGRLPAIMLGSGEGDTAS